MDKFLQPAVNGQANGDVPAAAASGSPAASKKAGSKVNIEKTYQKKSQLEHILLRPDTYIGSVEQVREQMWIYDKEEKRMVQKEISYVPGLYKIFDEILVNAADNKQRDPKMSTIKIDINQETNTISVWNNGMGIPVVMHKEEKMYVPTMIFGHLLTSSNYNDEEEKVTGGRNGYGAKLCNIFSSKFVVETSSKQYKKQFKQTWGDNMKKVSEAKVWDSSGEDFTKITFSPDLTKFKMTTLDDDIAALMCRRAYDIAASTRGVSVFLNGQKLPIKNFQEYVKLYLMEAAPADPDVSGPPQEVKIAYETVNERWEVAFATSEKGFQQVSFVNSIATTKGGRHVDLVADTIVKQLTELLKKKNKGGVQIKPFEIRNHMWLFVNCLIVNPTFDSQTKENMTLQAKNFGSKCPLTEKFFKNIVKLGVVERIMEWAHFKQQKALDKTSGKKSSKLKGIPKLDDANEAGGKNSFKCTLILTEGDSAKTTAMCGIAIVGRDHYGVFPLRGKLLNVREATHKQKMENGEINNLVKIIGLQYKQKYTSEEDIKKLRYGKVMIMTDQDQDGSHIKGLVINFFHTHWPELLRMNFLEEFITPIVKAKRKGKETLKFYSIPEFQEWMADTPDYRKWSLKYYKGLGTSDAAEARDYFEDIDRHRITFRYEDREDDAAIVMAFSKDRIAERKEWLTRHMEDCRRRKELGLPDQYLYGKETRSITYKDFINMELVLFSNMDNERSIPNMMDGLKPGQRKIIFSGFKTRCLDKEVKVAQLAGQVANISAYHHGEVSLQGTIVNLAQNYVGSNNLNLLMPKGQFGTRLMGGKDSASARYIFTEFSPLTKLIFRPEDVPLLNYLEDDNTKVEPVYYVPIIPMLLVNGAEGIGTGWATKVPNYNPRDLIKCLRLMLGGQEPIELKPWYNRFRGELVSWTDRSNQLKCISLGTLNIMDDNNLEITELPIGTWTSTYKENVLEALSTTTDKGKAIVADYKEHNTDTSVRFVITLVKGELERLQATENGLHKTFKLASTIPTTQMHAFDSNSVLRKYDTPHDVLREYYAVRYKYYVTRKDFYLAKLEAMANSLSARARFIKEKCAGDLVLENKKRAKVIEELVKRGFPSDPIMEWQKKNPDNYGSAGEEAKRAADGGDEEAESAGDNGHNFNYLVGMSMWFLTEEKKNQLLQEREQRLAELATLKMTSIEAMWLGELDELEAGMEAEEKRVLKEEAKAAEKARKGKAVKGSTKARAIKVAKNAEPAVGSIKIEFVLTDGEKAKYVKAEPKTDRVKKEKGEGGVAAAGAGKVKQEKGGEDSAMNVSGEGGDDDIDALIAGKGKKPAAAKAPAKPRVKKEKEAASSDGLKQGKLDFSGAKKKTPKKKKAKGSDDEDDMDGFNSDASGDVEFNVRDVAPARAKTGRAAAAKVQYKFSDDEEEKSDGDAELFENTMVVEESAAKVVLSDDDDDDSDFGAAEEHTNGGGSQNQSDMFDSLKEVESPAPKTKKAPAAKKAPAEKKPPVKRKPKDLSSSEELSEKKAPAKKKKKFSDSESDDDDDFTPIKKKPAAKKAASKKKKNYSDSEDDYSE